MRLIVYPDHKTTLIWIANVCVYSLPSNLAKNIKHDFNKIQTYEKNNICVSELACRGRKQKFSVVTKGVPRDPRFVFRAFYYFHLRFFHRYFF